MSRQVLSGAVTSEQQRASDIGTSILQQGANAVDAIIATVLAVGTLAPFHSDLGGGGFALIRTSEGQYEGLDFRHKAPMGVTMDFYKKGASTSVGGSAVAVPGEVRGLEALHQRYGRLSWSLLFEASINLAQDGMEMRGDLRKFITTDCVPCGSDSIKGSFYEDDEMFHSLFEDGRALAIGSTWKRPEYAETLQLIAKNGSNAIYTGKVAEALVGIVKERGGRMELEDLANYQAEWFQPISAKYRNYTLWTLPAPASGAIWLSTMGILSQFDPAPQGSVLDYHRVTEALRLAYGQRTELGDPKFRPEVVQKQKEWISEEYVGKRAKMLSDEKTFPPEYYTKPKVEISNDNGTSNVTVADSTGMVVSITTTVGLSWGSRIMVPGHGFILNDSMDDFSVEGRSNGTGYAPTAANYVQAGKKPLSSSCPYIIEDQDGKVVLAGGAAGGSTIISANAQIARNVLDYEMTAAEALRSNRLHNQILPNVSQLEGSSNHQGIQVDGFAEEMLSELERKGHKIERVAVNRSTPVTIKFSPNDTWEPAADPRKYDSGGSTFYAS